MALDYAEDIPAETPAFNYKVIAKALAPLLIQRRKGATIIGIHGPWGSGKSTLMQELQREVRQQFPEDSGVFIEFNAWKYQEREALWRALILRVLGAMREKNSDHGRIDELEASLYRSFAVEEKGPWRINWRTLIVEVLSISLSFVKLDFVATALRGSTGFLGRMLGWSGKKKDDKDDKSNDAPARIEKIASVLERTTVQRQVVQVQTIEQFLKQFQAMIDEFDAETRRVFVFVEDLDRCLPESALQIFEAIKLFLDAGGCGYVVALDRDVIRKGLAIRYAQQSGEGRGLFIDPDEYLEKTISVSFDLPRLSANDVDGFMDAVLLPIVLDATHRQIIVAGLGTNPRRVKRFMNGLAVQLELARLANEGHSPVEPCLLSFQSPGSARRFDYFLKLYLIGYRYSGVLALASKDPELLARIQRLSNEYVANQMGGPAKARAARNAALDNESSLLMGLKVEEEFWRLMREVPSFLDDFELTKRLLGWFRAPAPTGG
ncbi:MAG TPA: P-loop NTPase fold protein [Vicinamibacterales bacterium]|jgi:hypothetical protein|nr:P-loop NTPase fold protein [Vicinamibacterales bacterium]